MTIRSSTADSAAESRGFRPRDSQGEPRWPLHGPSNDEGVGELLGAARLLNRRGPGRLAWASPFRDDPIAFLLDSMSDAMNIWAVGGELLYQNRAAAELGVGSRNAVPLEAFSSSGRHFERRSLRCRAHGVDYVLEIIREVPPSRADAPPLPGAPQPATSPP